MIGNARAYIMEHGDKRLVEAVLQAEQQRRLHRASDYSVLAELLARPNGPMLCIKGNRAVSGWWMPLDNKMLMFSRVCRIFGIDPEAVSTTYFGEQGAMDRLARLQNITDLLPFNSVTWVRESGHPQSEPHRTLCTTYPS